MTNLSRRLSAIRDMVGQNTIVGDIGTDHGYIPLSLVENNISKKVIGTDISKGSLDKIIGLIKSAGLEDRIEARLGNGLDVIEAYEVDTIIIAGMGGILIKDILEKDSHITNSIKNFIFQPMVGAKELRQYLIHNNFHIIDEDLVYEEEKFYEIISAKRGQSHVEKDIYYEISPLLIEKNHSLLKEFINYKANKVKNILNDIGSIKTEKSMEKSRDLEKLLKDYEEVLLKIEGKKYN